jgi:guanylate kinase
MRRRLRVASREMGCARWYDHTVVNDRLPQAVRDVAQVIRQYTTHHQKKGATHGTDSD